MLDAPRCAIVSSRKKVLLGSMCLRLENPADSLHFGFVWWHLQALSTSMSLSPGPAKLSLSGANPMCRTEGPEIRSLPFGIWAPRRVGYMSYHQYQEE